MLTDGGQTTNLKDQSRTDGYVLRGQAMQAGAVVAKVPTQLEDAEQSVCGVKGFLVDEKRTFTDNEGAQHTIDCARIAALEIIDSPVHVHGETVETYHILEGKGKMILDEKVQAVEAGNIILLPPGTVHGLCSEDPDTPMRVLMTFSPGLAPIAHEQFRDERICYEKASQRIAQLEG